MCYSSFCLWTPVQPNGDFWRFLMWKFLRTILSFNRRNFPWLQEKLLKNSEGFHCRDQAQGHYLTPMTLYSVGSTFQNYRKFGSGALRWRNRNTIFTNVENRWKHATEKKKKRTCTTSFFHSVHSVFAHHYTMVETQRQLAERTRRSLKRYFSLKSLTV